MSKVMYMDSQYAGLTPDDPPIDFLNIFYPIGSYYETSDGGFDPNIFWGGTWSLETEGQVHVSAGSTYTAGSTYGSDTHTHTTGDVTLNLTQIPSHNHGQKSLSGSVDFRNWSVQDGTVTVANSGIISTSMVSNSANLIASGGSSSKVTRVTVNATHTHDSNGGGTKHNHGNTGSTTLNSWQPSIAVYRWHRTA